MTRIIVTAIAFGAAIAATAALAVDPIGIKPKNVPGIRGTIPNDAAIVKKIWAPGIDQGYDPQGVTIAEGAVIVSGYAMNAKGKETCGIFRVNPATGMVEGFFQLEAGCGHAGGIVYAGAFQSPAGRQNILLVADTPRLYKIDMDKAFRAGNAKSAIVGMLNLKGLLPGSFNGSFIDMVGQTMFMGTYATKSQNPALSKGYFIDYSLFDKRNGQVITETCCGIRSVVIPADSQGAAYDARSRSLWLTASSSKFGCLYRMDVATGRIAAAYPTAPGIEDIAVDGDGRLWAVSEAGSMKYPDWPTLFPVLFQIDPQALQASTAKSGQDCESK